MDFYFSIYRLIKPLFEIKMPPFEEMFIEKLQNHSIL